MPPLGFFDPLRTLPRRATGRLPTLHAAVFKHGRPGPAVDTSPFLLRELLLQLRLCASIHSSDAWQGREPRARGGDDGRLRSRSHGAALRATARASRACPLAWHQASIEKAPGSYGFVIALGSWPAYLGARCRGPQSCRQGASEISKEMRVYQINAESCEAYSPEE